MAAAYKLALPAMRAIEELLPQYIHAVEACKKKNESVNEWLAEATACRRCETPFVRVERPEHPRLVGHFGPVYGIACKRCNASVYPPPELHLMLRAEEFLKAALSLNRPASSEERPTHVVLFLLYHASELYLKCLGTYTYYIGDTPIDLATYETENKEESGRRAGQAIPEPYAYTWVCAYPASAYECNTAWSISPRSSQDSY